MITFLDGELTEKDPARIVIACGGVGYEVFIPLSSYDQLPPPGARCRMLTWLCVREDAHILYGFATEAERNLFLLLMDVSGIGPRTALAALSGMSARELKAAIVGGDVKRISSISGIGRKTAERIIVELKDKISDAEALEAVAGAPDATPEDLRTRDAMLALIALGFKQTDARDAVRKVLASAPAEAKVEDLVRRVLAAKK